jgi:hypothetical protein
MEDLRTFWPNLNGAELAAVWPWPQSRKSKPYAKKKVR